MVTISLNSVLSIFDWHSFSILILSCLILINPVICQADQDTQVSSPTLNPVISTTRTSTSTSTSTFIPTTSTSTSVVQATSTLNPIELSDGIPVLTELNSDSSIGAFFRFSSSTSSSISSSSSSSSIPVYITISICSGPIIPPYSSIDDTDDTQNTNKDSLNTNNPSRSSTSTFIRLYVSDQSDNPNPGPNSIPDNENQSTGDGIVYANGGYALLEFKSGIPKTTTDDDDDDADANANTDADSDVNADSGQGTGTAWIGIWPPLDTRNVNGTWMIQVTASTGGECILYCTWEMQSQTD